MSEIKEIFKITNESIMIERERCLAAIDAEPELPGEMPDDMWKSLFNDRDAITEAMRFVVRLTKTGIRERIISE